MLARTKTEIRKKLRAHRNQLNVNEQSDHALSVRDSLRASQLALATQTVGVYIANDGELELAPVIGYLLDHAVRVAVPQVQNDTMQFVRISTTTHYRKNRFGICEPISDEVITLDEKSIVLFPGVGFTRSGTRLGRGGGYYDRYFGEHPCLLRIGVAHARQVVDTLPASEHDVQLDALLTENGWEFASLAAQKYLNLRLIDGC